jgi:general secretion pathway protein G
MNSARGFTLIELVVALALVGLMAWISVPMYEVTMTRVREAELRVALRQIRTALDAYKTAVDDGLIAKRVTDSGYPVSLEVLVQGVERQRDAQGRRMVFLRQVPADPFAIDASLPPARQWKTRSYGSDGADFGSGADVFDIASRSTRVGMNGIPYGEW